MIYLVKSVNKQKEKREKMKVGIIGCGGMGTTHYLSWKALSACMDVEVTALADCREEFLEKAAEYFPEAKKYSTGMELIEQEKLDIVDICLPSYLHAGHALAAMDRGMHTFIEKPVCLTEEDGKKLLEAEKRTGTKVMVGQVVRSFDEYNYLKKVYDDKTYGRLKSIVMQRLSGNVNWGYEDWFHDDKRSGSVVLDLHVHDLDFLRYLLGEPDSYDVRAAADDSGMINQVITTYQFGKVFATAEGLWDVSESLPFEAGFRACFEDATVVFNGTKKPSVAVYRKDGTVENPVFEPEYNKQSDVAGINVSNLGPYYSEIKYFAECVRDNKEIKRAPLEEGVKSVQLALNEWEKAKAYVK